MLKKWIVLFLTTAFMLAACHSPVYNQTEGNVADATIKAADNRKKFDAAGKTQPPLLINQGLYVDKTPISLEKQPSWLKNHIVIRGDQLPFSYYARTIAAGANTHTLVRYQSGLDQNANISLNYTGTIKGALDLIATRTGYVYSVHGNNISWQAFVTKTFDVAFMPGSTDYMMGKASGGSNSSTTAAGAGGAQVQNYTSSDSSDSEYSNLSGKLSLWDDLSNTIKQLLSPEGKVVVSQTSTTVTVRDRPSNVELIGQYIRNLNSSLSRQVLVKVQVLEISLENDFSYGINWNLVEKAFAGSTYQLNASYGTPISITAFGSNQAGSFPTLGVSSSRSGPPIYSALINALNQQGKTSVVSEPRVVCLNNQVSVVRIVQQQGYVASVQSSTLSSTSSSIGSVTSQITPGNVITGLTLYILPKIMGNKVFLQANADLSTNNGFTTFNTTAGSAPGQPGNQIQLPNITEKHFNQRSLIHSGDTLILSGFRQVSNQTGAMQFFNSQALGGKGSIQKNVETVVLITPIILNGSI